MQRAVFFGSDHFSIPVLHALIEHGPNLRIPVQVGGVVTQPDRPFGRGRRVEANPVKHLAERHGLAVLQPPRIRDANAVDAILDLEPDVSVVASYGQILPARLLTGPRRESLNLHPSLLPLFRGPTPIVGALLAGHEITGTSLMLMTEKMDAGPILDRVETRIDPNESCGELTERLGRLSAELLLRCLPDWMEGRIHLVPQDHDAATYTRLLTKTDGRINWSENAYFIARKVMAYNPWPVAFTDWSGRHLRILRARAGEGEARQGHVAAITDEGLAIGTGRGLLIAQELQLEGGRPLQSSMLARGHPGIIGSILGDSD